VSQDGLDIKGGLCHLEATGRLDAMLSSTKAGFACDTAFC